MYSTSISLSRQSLSQLTSDLDQASYAGFTACEVSESDSYEHACFAESIIVEVASSITEKHGKKLTMCARIASIGKKPLEAWQATIDSLGIENVTAQQLFEESEPELQGRWYETRLMPGAHRLVLHLQKHGVQMAVATSTLRSSYRSKMAGPHTAPLSPHFQVWQ
jgi:beta-phosphoglucomutase-like phosphatase (HAD superfamily)